MRMCGIALALALTAASALAAAHDDPGKSCTKTYVGPDGFIVVQDTRCAARLADPCGRQGRTCEGRTWDPTLARYRDERPGRVWDPNLARWREERPGQVWDPYLARYRERDVRTDPPAVYDWQADGRHRHRGHNGWCSARH
jgi:hypothetical protein